MKAVKIAGVRLINYLNDNINWKDHKDIILDFWIENKCREIGHNPRQFKDMYYVEELPTEIQKQYENWFNDYDFQNGDDDKWITFIDGTLNIFYHTSNPTLMPEETWYCVLMKSEVEAREICETQIFHGNPNILSFWKLDTNTKAEEVGGRRNGYLFSNELGMVEPRDTRGYYWAVIFQCPPDTVKLYYEADGKTKSRCINWAADCKHITLLKVAGSGRFLMQQIFVEGKAWKSDRLVPQENTPKNPMTGKTLLKYIQKNYHSMYGIWDGIDEITKDTREAANQRKNAVNTMNDEEVKIGKVIEDITKFIAKGNVSPERRERNKTIRQAIREKNKLREKEIRKHIREQEKEKGKKDRKDRNRLNPFLSKK